MSPSCRRTRLPARVNTFARKLSRERIIPAEYMVQTHGWDVTAVTLRGSLPIVAVSLPLIVVPASFDPRMLPLLALFLTASHGSLLVHRRIRRR
ncbi:hypothetical protein GCM10010298_70400 [Streptomyces microflavus]|uniref:Uncharacterized protein n=1 Tax=Streptomyces microflavus TaxID=1919 RepID=A0A7J0D6M7_STRMI|nr:hypothetical protein Smic_83030 [Streptomyces microflavus]GGX94840.1 hypothetical protein GCM10010298_70400 [Streptomyces microflavus]